MVISIHLCKHASKYAIYVHHFALHGLLTILVLSVLFYHTCMIYLQFPGTLNFYINQKVNQWKVYQVFTYIVISFVLNSSISACFIFHFQHASNISRDFQLGPQFRHIWSVAACTRKTLFPLLILISSLPHLFSPKTISSASVQFYVGEYLYF